LALAVLFSAWLAPGQSVVAADPFSIRPADAHARVVSVQDTQATAAFVPDLDRTRAMVACGVTNLTSKTTLAAAWRSLVSTQDIVGIKVYSAPGPNSGTRPAVVAAVVEGLIAAGLPPRHIIVWDRQAADLRRAGFFDLAQRYGLLAKGSAQAGYDPAAFYETALLGNLVWGDLEFGKKGEGIGRRSFFSKLVTKEITRIINVTPLLNHNVAGVSGNLYSLALGSVDNIVRFESDADRLASAVPEIYASTNLSDRVALNITDALICQYEGGESSRLHYSTTLNQLWFSHDPVALDALALHELEQLRLSNGAPEIKPNLEIYNNAALLELGVNDLKKIRVEAVH